MDDSITTTLRNLTSDVERLTTEQIRPIGLTVPQMQFLAIFAANPDLCGTEAADAAHVSPQTGSTITQNLISKRLITVGRVPGAGRRNTITVTACGKDALDRALAAVADVNTRVAVLLGKDVARKLGDAVTALKPELPPRVRQPGTTATTPVPRQSNADADKAKEMYDRCREWAATVGETDLVPDYVALKFGTQTQIKHLVDAGRWTAETNGYRVNN